jgi:thioredoxin reductase (NADPH)
MNTRIESTDVAIIGAGPIGLELAVAFKRAGIEYLQFDAKQIGYTISWFPPQTRFFSSNDRIAIAGVPLQTPDQNKSTREEYLAYLRTVVLLFDLKINTYEPVTGIEGQDGGFRLTTNRAGSETQYAARKIVLATGGTAHPRRLNIPGEDLSHVYHSFIDPHEFFRRDVMIIGGKNSAVETALRLHNAGARVSISYRQPQFNVKSIKYWLMPEISGLLQSGTIRGYFNTIPSEITPLSVHLTKTDGSSQNVPTDCVLLMIGYFADMSLCRLAGVELTGECERPTYNLQTMESNVPGVYLAGTVIGGTQDKYETFIENGHVHTERIMAALRGGPAPAAPAPLAQPES